MCFNGGVLTSSAVRPWVPLLAQNPKPQTNKTKIGTVLVTESRYVSEVFSRLNTK